MTLVDSLLADNKDHFAAPEGVEGGVRGPNPSQKECKAGKDRQVSTLPPGGSNPTVYQHRSYHCANTCIKKAVGFYKSMMDHKDCHIPSPLMMFSCTAFYHALLKW